MKTRICVLTALLAVAGVVQGDALLTPMKVGELREATEALRHAQAKESLLQSAAGLKPKHDDHSGETIWLVPYAPLGISPQGFYSFENAEDYARTADILLLSDSGRLLRRAKIRVPGGQLTHINSRDILEGNPGKGITSTVIAQPREGEAAWAFVTAPAHMWIRAYVRTPGGFVSGMSDTLEEYISEGGYAVEHATFFNPGSNQSIVSVLRILNAIGRPRTAVITGTDALGFRSGQVRCRIGANQALMLSARALEEGPRGCTGRFGDGAGKWRLFVRPDNTEDFWFDSMSQLWGASGIVTNVSFPEPYHFTKP